MPLRTLRTCFEREKAIERHFSLSSWLYFECALPRPARKEGSLVGCMAYRPISHARLQKNHAKLACTDAIAASWGSNLLLFLFSYSYDNGNGVGPADCSLMARTDIVGETVARATKRRHILGGIKS